MSLTKIQQQTLALAAIFQACHLIYELGATGTCNQAAFETNIHSIYTLDAPNFYSIFGNIENLKHGLEVITHLLAQKNKTKEQALISRYAFDIIFLQRKLMKKTETLDYIRRRLKHAALQRQYFNEINDTIIENLSDIYSHSISQFHYKVQIIGKLQYMKNPKVFNQIRALLLSAIRASVLWQQLGGKRHHLFLARNRLLTLAKELLLKTNQR